VVTQRVEKYGDQLLVGDLVVEKGFDIDNMAQEEDKEE
jgi:hypothetical protein